MVNALFRPLASVFIPAQAAKATNARIRRYSPDLGLLLPCQGELDA
jgi:hypothetical protein